MKTGILEDLLLFAYMAAFVTGIASRQ